jgi:hypothetical protein
MLLPEDLAHKLFQFASTHYNSSALLCSPAEMGIACEQIAAEWCVAQGSEVSPSSDEMQFITALAARFGKCLGDFYHSEREG